MSHEICTCNKVKERLEIMTAKGQQTVKITALYMYVIADGSLVVL